jgi:hypothetical protein
MVTLPREERRRRVLELHNQGKGTREISEILQMSFRDIGYILKDADKNKEAEQQRSRQELLSSQAYKLFSEGKSPVEVAIKLNIRASEAIVFQREYWELDGLHNLNQIYEDIKGNPWPLVNLSRSIMAAFMDVSHVITLLKIANNDLPTLEYKYVMLKNEVKSLEEQKRNLYNQVTLEGSNLEYYRVQSRREIDKFNALQERSNKAEAIVTQFENNNFEYVKVKRTIEEELRSRLLNRKSLLRLAALCITESIRENPEKYRYLVHREDEPSVEDSTSDFNPFWIYGPPQQLQYQSKIRFIEDYVAMLTDDGNKLMEKLVKGLGIEIIDGYTSNKSLQPSLSLFHLNIEQINMSK